jgi:hypothetical protein
LARSLRAQWSALEQASMATRQPRGQLLAPGEELLALERLGNHPPASGIDGVDLDQVFARSTPTRTISSISRAISLMGTSPLQAGLNFATQS